MASEGWAVNSVKRVEDCVGAYRPPLPYLLYQTLQTARQRPVYQSWYCSVISVMLGGLVSSVLCREIGWEERLQNDLFCVEWNVKS